MTDDLLIGRTHTERQEGMDWYLELICCGRENGTQWFFTPEDAATFRRYYLDAYGHDRVAILKRVDGEDTMPVPERPFASGGCP